MKVIINLFPHKRWMLFFPALLLFTSMLTGYGSLTKNTSFFGPHILFSNTNGTKGEVFTSKLIIERDDFITNFQLISVEGLPPGLSFAMEKLEIEGIPTQAGMFKVVTKYNDKEKGSIKHGVGGYWTNYTEILISE